MRKTAAMRLVEKLKKMPIADAVATARQKAETTQGAAEWLGVSVNTFKTWEERLKQAVDA